MINTSLIDDYNHYNDFTRTLAKKCKTKGSALVKLRNNDIVEVELCEQIRNGVKEVFFKTVSQRHSWHHVWYLDGSSNSSYVYDILMMGSKKLLSNRWEDFV